MWKKLILFCTFAIFMLVVGGAVTPVWGHCKGKHDTPDHPHCNALAWSEYGVAINGGYDDGGPILPGTGLLWVYDGKMVASLNPRSDQLNISYFDGKTFDNLLVSARQCFGTVTGNTRDKQPLWPEVKFGGFLRKHGKSTAQGMFWFRGTTSLVADGPVLYLLKIEGKFVDPPNNPLGFPKIGKIMRMEKWTLKLENQGADVTSRACVGERVFDSPFDVEFFGPLP